MLERTDTTRVDRECGGFEYEKRKAGNPGMDLKCPRSSHLNLDYCCTTQFPLRQGLTKIDGFVFFRRLPQVRRVVVSSHRRAVVLSCRSGVFLAPEGH